MKKRSFLLLFCALLALSVCFAAHASGAITEMDFTYSSRGVSIHATLVSPRYARRCPVVIMAHGHHGSRDQHFGFSVIARKLAERGIASIRLDFPGCGESEEPFTANTLTNMKADMLAAKAYAENALGASAVGFFGYSMGGRVVLELLAEGAAPKAAAFLAPAADTGDLRRVFGGDEQFSRLHAEALQMGSAALAEDEIVSSRWFDDLLTYEDPAASAAGAYTGPSLVIYGNDDTVIPQEVALAAADKLNAMTLDAGGKGHGYGFFREDDELLARISEHAASFFSEYLK